VRRNILALVAALAASSPAYVAQTSRSATPDFTYDRSRPPTVTERDVRVREVSYVDVDGRPTAATLIAPRSSGKYPAVLFVHWYGPEHTNSNRTQYVPDALVLADKGIVSLLVDTPWSEPTWFVKRNPAGDADFSTTMVKRLRRALDVLASAESVDSGKLALVGHDFGAMYGAIAAGLEPRVTAFVFTAGTAKFADWWILGRKLEGDARAAVYAEHAAFDPVVHIARVKAPTLLQFATRDPYVSRESAQSLIDAAAGVKDSKFYEAGHEMSYDAMVDRVAWLAKTLGR
jgi:cephalosporin-C deacetylase-like acetyl esterase